MVKYADYNYYKDDYGGAMPENRFNRFVIEASAYIRKITFDRIDPQRVPEEVKYACCAMCDAAFEAQETQVDGKDVKSVSNDDYSVTFADSAGSFRDAAEMKMSLAAGRYLPSELTSFAIYDERGRDYE